MGTIPMVGHLGYFLSKKGPNDPSKPKDRDASLAFYVLICCTQNP